MERVGLSSCVTLYEYYIQDNSLLFVYGQEKVFKYVDRTATFDPNNQIVSMECRFYFESNKLLKSNFTGQTRCSESPSEGNASTLLGDAKKYIAQLKSNYE